jgi:hypothetical protein
MLLNVLQDHFRERAWLILRQHAGRAMHPGDKNRMIGGTPIRCLAEARFSLPQRRGASEAVIAWEVSENLLWLRLQ